MLSKGLNHLDSTHSLSNCQWGFSAGKSKTGALINAIEIWQQVLESGFSICAVFFDLQKAFDSVPHKPLLQKLANLNIDPIYIHGSHTTCIIEPSVWVLVVLHWMPVQSCREFFRDCIGTTQLLLLICIDDISRTFISSGSLTLYADDLVLYRPVCSSSDYRLLQQDIDTKSSWTSTNYLSHNPTKCKVISRKQQPPIPTVSLKANHSNSERDTI